MIFQITALAVGHQLNAMKQFQKSWMDGFKTFSSGGGSAQDMFVRSDRGDNAAENG